MFVVDIIIIIALGFFVLRGLKNGFIIELGSIVGLIAGLFFTSKFSQYILNLIQDKDFFALQYLPQISYIITFIIILILVALLAKILTKIAKFIQINWLNKLGGLFFGFFKGILIIGGFLFIISLLQNNFKILLNINLSKSIFYEPIINFFYAIFNNFKELIGCKIM